MIDPLKSVADFVRAFPDLMIVIWTMLAITGGVIVLMFIINAWRHYRIDSSIKIKNDSKDGLSEQEKKI